MNLLEQDARARERIATETQTNFFVEAGAGSGKTTALVGRMAAMVGNGIPIHTICAITFTKAAAREFYLRFQRELDARSRDENYSEETRRRCKQALVEIDRCFMGTIDAFCNKILSEHPVEAGVPMGTTLQDEEALSSACRREWYRMKRGEAPYGEELRAAYTEFVRWHSRPDTVFAAGIRMLLNTRTCPPYPHPNGPGFDVLIGQYKEALRPLVELLREHPHLCKDNKTHQEKLDALLQNQNTLLGSWDGRVDRVLQTLKKADGMFLQCPAGETDLLEPLCMQDLCCQSKVRKDGTAEYKLTLDEAPHAILGPLREAQYDVTLHLLDAFARLAAPVLKQNGELGFFDFQLGLRDMLLEDIRSGRGKLTRYIAQNHAYYLVDEFQDTDPLQTEILFFLTAEKPVESWEACVPRPGALFIVGDPKQSIYRFRGADVSSFMRVRALFNPPVGEVLSLTRNFRSTPILQEWFNKCFARCMPEDTNFQGKYPPIPIPTETKPQQGLTGAYGYLTEESKEEAITDPDRTASLIAQLTGDPAYTLEDGRRIQYRDIMVITRAKTHLADYMQALDVMGIPYYCEGRGRFSQCVPLVAATKVLTALAWPQDSLAVCEALTCGLYPEITADTLAAYREEHGPLCLSRGVDEEEENGPISMALESLVVLAKVVVSLPPATALLRLADELDIFGRLQCGYLDHFWFAVELLRQAESTGQVASLPDMASFLADLLADGSHERILRLAREENSVHLANLHKVKGLEAPVVILAGTGARPPSVTLSVNRQAGTRAIKCIQTPQSSVHAQTTRYADAEEVWEKSHLDAEVVRQQYVAATRACNLLLIACKSPEQPGAAWAPLITPALPMWSQDTSATATTITNVVGGAAEDTGETPQSLHAALDDAKRESYHILRPSLMKVKSIASAQDEYDDMIGQEIETAARKRDAALEGTLVHRLMELLVQAGGMAEPAAVAKQAAGEFELELGQREAMIELLLTVARQMQSGGYPQENGAKADLFAELASVDQVYCEVPFCVQTRAPEFSQEALPVILHGIIDLMYEKEGSWHIVDYKTTAETDALDEKYERQMAAYCHAFEQTQGVGVSARIYHIDTR